MKTVIIGGGLAGLVSAFRAQEQGSEVVVLESSRRLGGTMRTVTLEPGVRIEAGPQSFRQGSVEMARLLGDLGLQDQVVEAHPNSRRRFILRLVTEEIRDGWSSFFRRFLPHFRVELWATVHHGWMRQLARLLHTRLTSMSYEFRKL